MTRDLCDRVEALGRRLRDLFAGPNTDVEKAGQEPVMQQRVLTPAESVHEAVGEVRSSAQHLKTISSRVVEQNEGPDSFEQDMVRLLGRIQ